MSLISESQAQQQLGLVGAAASTKRLLHTITQVSRKYVECDGQEAQENWFGEVVQLFDWCQGMEEGSAMGRAALLINLEAVWPDLPFHVRDKYHNNFHYFAEVRTGKNWTTLENHMRAVKTFFIDQIKPADVVEIPQRDQAGAVILDSAKSPTFNRVRWDPTTVSISKLVAITARAKAGKMNNKLWSIVADPGSTWEQLQIALSEPDPGANGNNGAGGEGGGNEIQFYVAGPYLFVREGEVEAYVGDLSLPHDDDIVLRSSDTLRERALRRIFVMLGVKEESEEATSALKRVGLQIYDKIGT